MNSSIRLNTSSLERATKASYKKTIRGSNLTLLFMCVPAALLMLVFRYIPIFGIIMAFKDFNVQQGILLSKWNNFENFMYFFKSMDVVTVIRNTVFMNILFIITGNASSIFVALILYEIRKNYLLKFYQTVMFFPYFLSYVVVSFLVFALLSHDRGVLNVMLKVMGQQEVMWYNEAHLWPLILVLVNIWKGMGYGVVVYYTSLIGIDTEYFDAAALDGASKLQMIRHISLPFLKPMMLVLLILGVGGIMYSDFGLFFQVTRDQGALYEYTDVLDTYLYRAIARTGDLGIASAVNFTQSVVGFALVLLANKVIGKIDRDSALF